VEPRADEKKRGKRWFHRFRASARRKAERREVRGLVAYYWDGGAPVAHGIRDASSIGLYMSTDRRWYLGTLVTMTLQSAGIAGTDPDLSIVVQARVVRSGTDGVGFAFVMPEGEKQKRGQNNDRSAADKKTVAEFLQRFIANEGEMQ
jgi:hypothetical protein